MRTRQVVLISVLSCVLTLAAAVAFLSWTGSATAQKGDPPADPNETVAGMPAEGDPNAIPVPGALLPAGEAQPEAVTSYQHVAGSAFVPLYGDSGVVYSPNGCTYMTNASHAYMNYALNVPSGSTITYIRLYFNDTAATDGTLYLAQYDDGAAHTYLATLTTQGTAGLGTSTLSGLTIQPDYLNYNYVMYWLPGVAGSTMQLCGFRVNYTEPIGRVQLLPTSLLNSAP